MSKVKKYKGFDHYEIIEYTPSFFNLFGSYYPEKITIRRIIRFYLALPDGYKIYSLVENGKAVGYCTIQSGKSPRFDYSDKNDIIVGPYVIMPDYQGNGLAKELIKRVLDIRTGSFNYAYAYIKKENIPSIKTCEKLNFEYFSDAEVTSIIANVKKTTDKSAHYIIMRKAGN